jgi:TPP-dependent trihydroxycyclohexane-1,2-dione (THcHDO) dehydratase
LSRCPGHSHAERAGHRWGGFVVRHRNLEIQIADQPKVCVLGDGGLMMSLTELSTAVRLGANVVVGVTD